MKNKISRRDFIKNSSTGIIIGGAMLSNLDISKIMASSRYGKFQKISGDIILKLTDPKNSELKKVGGSVFIDDETLLLRISQTQFITLSLICRHKGCIVEKEGNQFVCPCHGSEYSLEGKVTHGPAESNLITYPTQYDVSSETVTIKIPDKE